MIEGKACSGKGTIAKELANEIGYTYIDAGLIFRSVVYLKGTGSKAEYLWKNKEAVIVADGIDITKELSVLEVGQATSKMASEKKGFLLLSEEIKRFSKNHNRIICDGIGMNEIVFPETQWKFYLNASLKVRAERRWKDLLQQGIKTNYKLVYENLEFRDEEDLNRKFCPLKIPNNAKVIDTSKMTIKQCVNTIKAKLTHSN